jgi:hypothetical protein
MSVGGVGAVLFMKVKAEMNWIHLWNEESVKLWVRIVFSFSIRSIWGTVGAS